MDEKIKIFKPEDSYGDIINSYEVGQLKGTTTYNDNIDLCWKWRRQEANICSGYNNEGKSLFIKQMSLIKSLEENQKFIFCSPEDYPPEEFFLDAIHTITGRSTDKENSNYVDRDSLDKAYNLIKDKFIFIYIEPPHNTVKSVIEEMKKIIEKEKDVLGCIIDPLIKFARPKDMSDRDDIYASYLGSICTDFCRTYDISFHLTIHQVTPQKGDNKNYPEPDVYRIRGGGVYVDSFDNCLTVWRPNYASDKLDPTVQFASQKIKKHKLVAIPQKYQFSFDRKTNRYIDKDTEEPLWNFDKFMTDRKLKFIQ